MTDFVDAEALAIVRLRDDQEEACGTMLARAFADDPIFTWVEPADRQRALLLEELFLALTRRSHRLAVALTTAPTLIGASLWKGPDLKSLTREQLALTGLDRISDTLSPAASARFDAVFDPIGAAMEADAPEPVWYLGVLGVAPDHQGKGLGSRLMRPMLERADREGLPVTLETAKARNLPLYRRHGFEVLRELSPPEPDGPVVWTMKRPAASRR